MKIVLETPETLTIRDHAFQRVLTGGVLACAGISLLILLLGQPDPGALGLGAWVAALVCAAFALTGVHMLATVADTTLEFARRERSVRLTERRLRARHVTELSFDAIEDVVLQETTMQNGRFSGSNYRVAFQCGDGTTVPWTSHFSPAGYDVADCAAAARAFGGWARAKELDASQSPEGLPASGPADENSQGNWGCTGSLLIVFMLIGISMATYEWRVVRAALPVPATITASGISIRPHTDRDTYEPDIRFQYQVNGVAYTGTRTLPSPVSSSRSWAAELAERFPVGAQVTAWYTPDAPDDAFLVRKVSKFPYFLIGVPILIVVLFRHTLPRRRRREDSFAGAMVPVVQVDGSSEGVR